MKDWRCRKTINMDEVLYFKIRDTIPPGLQSKFLGAIVEEYYNNLPDNITDAYAKIAELLVRCCMPKEEKDGNTL